MNNVFNLKRFGKYFTYDLNNAVSNYGISAVTTGLMPLIALFFSVIFGLLFHGQTFDFPEAIKIMLFGIAVLIVVLSAPVKLYGRLTERKSGTDWLMIPASPFEKFLSMAIMVCLVLPVVVFGLFFLCDIFLGWAVPLYGNSFFLNIKDAFHTATSNVDIESVSPVMSTTGGVIASVLFGWCASILPFTLGAVCFKKAKAAKTILCLIALEMVFSFIAVLFLRGGFANGFADGTLFLNGFADMSSEKLQFWANFLLNALYLVVVGGLLTGLFFRVKTIKH